MLSMKNMKIGSRMIFSFGIVIFLMLGVGFVSFQMLRLLSKDINDIRQDFYVKVRITSKIAQEIGNQGQLSRDMLILHGDQLEALAARISASRDEVRRQYDLLTPMVKSGRGLELLGAVQGARAEYVKGLSEFLERVKDGRADSAKQFLNEVVREHRVRYASTMEDFIAYQEELMNKASVDAESKANTGVRATLLLSAAAITLAIYLGRALSKSVTLPVKAAVALAEKVARGDLTTIMDGDSGSNDEVGQLLHALKRMNESLVNIVSQVRVSADAIAIGSSEVASGSSDLSQRTEEQASNLEQTAASMEQLAAAVQQNAMSSQTARKLASDASAVAAEGGEIVGSVVSTMGEIAHSARRVEEIIRVIEGIAFQTNILSLNAAVEAARAGDQGRSFAVVAGEVRVLAHRSAEAAKEIKSLITDSVSRVDRGSELVADAGRTMDRIVEQASNVSSLITAISLSSEEQKSGISQVSDAVQQLDQVTQQNAALVEESAAAADSLRIQALRLSEAVASFRLPSKMLAPALVPCAHHT